MKKFQYLEVNISKQTGYPGQVSAKGTEADSLDWIPAEVERFAPGCAIMSVLSGIPSSVSITPKNLEDTRVFWWIRRELGLRGWESFAVTTFENFAKEECHYFRREVDSD